ncbi:hypothetical protein DVT68_06455 [Dyella solisilvae]|uniref:Glycosyltransferase RgtA/B/C/D-like domain-containing protein n=1 Tax=Dyella solisilvae TaxID=1920168 RepID=A0A370KCX8_9GAMM|nr:hypothetical protein [Dyella solisilvae]RDJ00432.1 hypothetical protein DVT68_06455 [Dyella solisilvae]
MKQQPSHDHAKSWGSVPYSALANGLAVGVWLLALVFNLLTLVWSWSQPILDQHGFRQTQTALSAYWLHAGGPLLAYQTPTLGAPWTIPFEFPLYQWFVAALAGVLPFSLDQVGRLVSDGFFLATLWPLASITRSLGADRKLFLVASGLLVLSPMYLFWSRALMIESTALFFSVGFVSLLMAYFRRPSTLLVGCLIAAAALASCVKITTFVGFALAGAIITLADFARHWRTHSISALMMRYLWPALAILIAIVTLAMWTHYADALKTQSRLGAVLTSTNLNAWNFGTFPQRVSGALWRDVVWGRSTREAIGAVTPLILALAAAAYLGKKAMAGLGVALVLYVAPFLIFTNLHIVHNYYQYANGLFLVLGLAYVAWQGLSRNPLFGSVVFVLLVGFELLGFHRYFYPDMRKDMSDIRALRVASFLDKQLPSDAMFVGFGLDWASDVPYYSKRKALLFPDWHETETLRNMRQAPSQYTGGLALGAIVECPNKLADMPDMRDAYVSYMHDATAGMQQTVISDCKIYYRAADAGASTATALPLAPHGPA